MAAFTGRKFFCLLRFQLASLSSATTSNGSRFLSSVGQGSKNTQGTKKPPQSSPPPAPKASPAASPQQTANVSGATEGYKVKEYFEHNAYSFYDIHADMSKSRLPQPSSRK
uniref:Putative secreted mucin n=1 Tax=Amblyomma triste TaxID=251400 RepID=A0A023G0I6_AMBTT